MTKNNQKTIIDLVKELPKYSKMAQDYQVAKNKEESRVDECFRSIRHLEDLETGQHFLKAVRCNSWGCPHCYKIKVDTLQRKINNAVQEKGLVHFFTLTNVGSYDDLNDSWTKIRKAMYDLNPARAKSKGSDYRKIQESYVVYEIEKMFWIKYLHWAMMIVVKKHRLKYKTVDEIQDKKAFINKYGDEIKVLIDEKLLLFKTTNSTEKRTITPFLYTIKAGTKYQKEKEFKSYNKLVKYCFKKIFFRDDEQLSFVRVVELGDLGEHWHYHILCNRYIPHALMDKVFKGNPPIYQDLELTEGDTFKTQIERDRAVVKYITSYISKDIAATISRYKMSTGKAFQLVESSSDIDVSTQGEHPETKGKYRLVNQYGNVTPNEGWAAFKSEKEAIDYVYGLRKDKDINKYLEQQVSIVNDKKSAICNLKIDLKKGLITPDQLKKSERELHEKGRQALNEINNKALWESVNYKLSINNKAFDVRFNYQAYLRGLADKIEPLVGDFSKVELRDYYLQQVAICKDICNKNKHFVFVMGNAGSGKTTTVSEMLKYVDLPSEQILVTALTAKAADVLSNKGVGNACTIHRACGARYNEVADFMKNRKNYLKVKLVIIDEVSLLDKWTLSQLLQALPDGVKIIFCGDQSQLNPVQSNSLIAEFSAYNSEFVSMHYFNINFRSADKIATTAKEILAGDLKNVDIKTYNYKDVVAKIAEGYKVICNSRRMVDLINDRVTKAEERAITWTASYSYDIGQDVMICRNDYRQAVYNGNICKVVGDEISSDGLQRIILSTGDGRQVKFTKIESTDMICPCFAMTVHKAQGSEYDKVAVIIDDKDMLISNNMIYTAYTRARQDVLVYIDKDVDINRLKIKQSQDTDDYFFKIAQNEALSV